MKISEFYVNLLNQGKEIFHKIVGSVEKLVFYLKTLQEFITLEVQSPVESEISSETQNSCHFRTSVKIRKFYVKPKQRNILEIWWFHGDIFLPEEFIKLKFNHLWKVKILSEFYVKPKRRNI